MLMVSSGSTKVYGWNLFPNVLSSMILKSLKMLCSFWWNNLQQLCRDKEEFNMSLDLSTMSTWQKRQQGYFEQHIWGHFQKTFTDDQLRDIPIDIKVGEYYFGHFSEQLREKGGSDFKVISDRLILKSSVDLEFADSVLRDKELKAKRKEIEEIEAKWCDPN